MHHQQNHHAESAPLSNVLNAAPLRSGFGLADLDQKLQRGLEAAGLKIPGLDSIKAAQLTLESVDLKSISSIRHRNEDESTYGKWRDLLAGSGHTLHVLGDSSLFLIRGAHSDLRMDEINQSGSAVSIRYTDKGLEFRSLGGRTETPAVHSINYRNIGADKIIECDPQLADRNTRLDLWPRVENLRSLEHVRQDPQGYRVMAIGSSNSEVPAIVLVVPRSTVFLHSYENFEIGGAPEGKNLDLFGFRVSSRAPFHTPEFKEFEMAKILPGSFAPRIAEWPGADRDLHGCKIALLRTEKGFAVVVAEPKENSEILTSLLPTIPRDETRVHETKNFRFVTHEGKSAVELARFLKTLTELPDLIHASKVDLAGASC